MLNDNNTGIIIFNYSVEVWCPINYLKNIQIISLLNSFVISCFIIIKPHTISIIISGNYRPSIIDIFTLILYTCNNTVTPVRLVDGPHRYAGRLEVYYKGEWGSVCGGNFDDDDADVVCRMLRNTTVWSV